MNNLHTVATIARELISAHGLTGWRFEFDRAVRRMGCCKYKHRVISLSAPLSMRAPMDEIRDTILHEIAHALVGPGAGHGLVWYSKARSIGCNGKRCSDVEIEEIPGKWQAVCPGCGRTFHKHRRPNLNRLRICRACGRERGKLVYSAVR